MLFNLQNLFQTEDNKVKIAGQEDHLGGEVDFYLYNYSVETKLLDPVQQL